MILNASCQTAPYYPLAAQAPGATLVAGTVVPASLSVVLPAQIQSADCGPAFLVLRATETLPA